MYFIPGYLKETFSENQVVIDSELYGNRILLDAPEKIAEYQKIKESGTEAICTELEKFLYEQKMLCSLKDLQNLQNVTYQKMQNRLGLTIMPTEGCNFRCPYCYEDHENRHMTSDIVDAIKNFLKEQIVAVQEVNISWFGGEPTLCPDVVLEIGTYAYSLVKKSQEVKFSSSMTTNGYLLNKEMFLKFYACGIRNYQITLDGFKHDETRYLANKQGTLKTILSNLREIKQLDSAYEYKILLRRNILATDNDFSWYDYLAQQFNSDSRFSILIRSVDDWGGEEVKKLSIIQNDDRERVLKMHIDYATSKGLVCENDMVDNSNLFGRQFCYASYPKNFVFRANGNIQKCTIALQNNKNTVGQIIRGKVFIDTKLNQCWTPSLQEICISCKRILSCMNKQCPKRIALNQENVCCQTGRLERL